MLKLTKRPKSPYYVARGTIDGKRVEVSTKCEKLADAKARLPGIIASLSAGTVDQRSELTFMTALLAYEERKPKARFLSPLKRYFKDTLVSEITNAEMRKAAASLYPKASDATIRRQLYTPVKAILNQAADDDLCSPPRIKAPTGGGKRTVFLLPLQADALLKELGKNRNAYLKPLVTFLLGQGCRLSEALNLVWSDVSIEHRFAILRDTKNGEERRITLIPKVSEALAPLPSKNVGGPVFRRLDGAGFPVRDAAGGQISKAFGSAVEAAKLDPSLITPHVCRHTWATWFYAQTKDVRRLQDEGGWKSGEWQRYTKLGTPDLGRSAKEGGWDFSESE